jgi:hypothetical protein
MPISNLGLLVSGESDRQALPVLARKHLPSAYIKAITVNGSFKGKIVRYLKIFQYDGHNYDRVIIIDDSDGADPAAKELKLTTEVGSRTFPFDLSYLIIVQELETWLLADENALTMVSRGRGGTQISRVNGTMEDIQSPKELLIRTLEEAGAGPYVAETARMIAAHADTSRILSRCQRYQLFINAIS